ncbi:ATP-binding response regulator [Methylotetracoccus oryzae]|uniref:ATP-binding response regulator n=1 Tax=Methylotetracoccus oryzae TaxID=1919059 RepID=UPI00111907FD|nr:ATP-binding protein [Methylotetracoccus oryzae]
MKLNALQRLGALPFVTIAASLIVLCAVGLVAALDLLLKGSVLPVDLLIGGLTGLLIGPVFVYIPFQLGRRVQTLSGELDEANLQLRSEAESLRQLASELARANQRLGFSQSLARIAYYEVDLGSGTVTGSPELFALFPIGANQTATLGGWREQVHPHDRGRFSDLIDRCAHLAESVELDFRVLGTADTERWLHLYGELAPGDGNSAGSVLGIVQDITEQRRAEALRRANERLMTDNAALAEADRMKDEFLATMSHELRTPLTGVLSLAEALQEEAYGPLNMEQQEKLGIIESSGRHLLRLINDILDLAKIRSGTADVVREDFLLREAYRPALATIQRLALERGLDITVPEDAQIWVHGDPLRLKQILLNLLGNAIKFTPGGGRIGLEVRQEAGAREVQCTVWDTGVGIATEDLAKLFQPFVQLDSRLARCHGGAGLGLCLAQRLAELQGGRITVSSRPGVGSRFTVHLPLARVTVAEPGERLPEPAANPAPPGRGKVLLVDDDEINRDIYREYLELKGFAPVLAEDGQQALALALTERPDVIVMDVQMPVMDGLEATRRLRAADDPRLAETPVIALSALAMPGDRQRCIEAGCDVYLSKPVRLDELVRTLTVQLERRHSAAAENSPAR